MLRECCFIVLRNSNSSLSLKNCNEPRLSCYCHRDKISLLKQAGETPAVFRDSGFLHKHLPSSRVLQSQVLSTSSVKEDNLHHVVLPPLHPCTSHSRFNESKMSPRSSPATAESNNHLLQNRRKLLFYNWSIPKMTCLFFNKCIGSVNKLLHHTLLFLILSFICMTTVSATWW